MDRLLSYSLNCGLEHDIILLEEMSKKRFHEKSLEIDEACYSLEEPEQDEVRTLPTSYRRPILGYETARMSSFQSQVLERPLNSVLYRRNETTVESVVSALTPRGVVEESCYSNEYKPICHFQSDELQVSGETVIPDFDFLLSGEVEREESTSALQMRCQELIQAGHTSDKIFDELKILGFLGQGSDESGSFDVTSDGLDEDASWTEDECLSVVEMMRIGALCQDPSCHVSKCRLGQKMISDIELDLGNFDSLLPLVTRRLLDSVIVHASLCDDSQCSVRWCSFFTQYRDLPLEEQRARLQGRYRKRQFAEDFEEINIEISPSSEFIQLEPGIVWPCVQHAKLEKPAVNGTRAHSVPKNGIDFLVNGHFGKYGQLGLTAMSTTLPPIQLNIIQYVSWESSSVLWKSLKGLSHKNIVRHLWSCVDSSTVIVCRDHFCTDTESLESLVNKVKPRKIDTTDGLAYVAGLVSAVRYLNDNGIYYLKWTASGIQMNYNYTLAQLCDFSLAVSASSLKEDQEIVDVISNSLPPHVIPPEMFSNADSEGVLGSMTDVWGIGCIIYHLSCGQPVHYDLRHEQIESLRETVETFVPQDHLKSIKSNENVKKILAEIFTTEESRIDIQRLAVLLESVLSATP